MKGDELVAWRIRHNLLAVLLDFDDVISRTGQIFAKQMRLFVEQSVLSLDGVSFETVMQELERINNAVQHTHKVNPVRWQVIVQLLAESFGLGNQSVFHQHLHLLMEIYQTSPEFHEGALETLVTFREAGFRLGVITHANEDWTWFKLRQLGLETMFQSVTIAHEDGVKGCEDWSRAVNSLDVQPEETIAIGDNVKGDILAAEAAGIRTLVKVPSIWRLYGEGELPQGVIAAAGIGAVIEALLRT